MTQLVISIDFLTGRYVASSHFDRDLPEWPPHPARLFSAMVAEHHASEDHNPAERAALEWLERLPPPAIVAGAESPRPSQTHFVPINDTSVLGLSLNERRYSKLEKAFDKQDAATTDAQHRSADKAMAKARDVETQVTKVGRTPPSSALELLPAGREKQARTYPSVTPTDPQVQFVWQDVTDMPDEVHKSLAGLLTRVTRLGHSSSLVWARLADEAAEEPTLVPDIDGDVDIRTTGAGQLRALERRFAVHKGLAPRSLPAISTAYRSVGLDGAMPIHQSVFADGDWFAFAHRDGPHLHATKSLSLAKAARGALMSSLEVDIPALLSGHDGDGAPVQQPHAAIVPLPFIDHEHATGLTLGFAVVVPPAHRTSLHDGRQRLLAAIAAWEDRDGDGGVNIFLRGGRHIEFERELTPRLETLRQRRWCRPSRTWASATPIALDRHPGSLNKGKPATIAKAFAHAERTVAKACQNIGLPQPACVHVSLTPPLTGARPAAGYRPFGVDRKLRRALVHATIQFNEPVTGPVLLGAGRYLGYGLMAPTNDDRLSGGNQDG